LNSRSCIVVKLISPAVISTPQIFLQRRFKFPWLKPVQNFSRQKRMSRIAFQKSRPILSMNGQPKKNSGALLLVSWCALIAVIACLVASKHSVPARRLWMPVVVETNGNETVLGETRQMEFWTPSAGTKDYLHKDGGEVDPKDKWQVIPGDDTVLQFGFLLHSNVNVLGYRRVEVWGQGRSNFKPGWWWTMNVFTNYSVGDLAHTYQEFWKSSQPVFVEVIDNRGSEEK
jgi:hypothetical protein